ncbi:TetR family transcriptional regulator [Streptomyces sp. NPDC000618]|uniref:TetR/AcrR family transcriptional regulator n=1 Tax=Streptomyces sp. NPDC000618 TaxID=3154265 RepID=UPI003319B26B
MTTFQRARSEEQRSERRLGILLTASAMLSEMPVSEVSLNELSRRAGLAKSGLLRYFESREAVLLELLTLAARDFLAEAGEQLASLVDAQDPLEVRAEAVASGLAASFGARPMLCELLSAQAGVLEYNVSVEVATRFKQTARGSLPGLAEMLRKLLPELGQEHSGQAATLIILLIGGLWTHTNPAPAVRAVYRADPSFSFMDSEFTDALHRSLSVLFAGFLTLG